MNGSTVALLILAGVGGVASLAGHLLAVLGGFKTSNVWGLVALLVPGGAVVWCILHFDRGRTALFLIGAGLAAGIGSVVLAGSAVGSQLESAQRDLAATQVANLEQAVRLFELKERRLPTTEEGLEVLVSKRLLEKIPVDPWNKPFGYRVRDERPIVRSAGPDGKFDTKDDIESSGAIAP